jgi:hypothetical protein
VASVGAHEVGHALGLGHTPVGGATMFPRTASGNPRPRTVHADDLAGVAGLYPSANWLDTTARVSGTVRDGGGQPVGGVHVVAQDDDGCVVGATLSGVDGSYLLEGLPDGPLELWAEPIDALTGPGLFTEANLPRYWRGRMSLDVLTSTPVAVTAQDGADVGRDLVALAGVPSWNVALVAGDDLSFGNRPVALIQGEKNVDVGVAAPAGQLPGDWADLSVSGSGVVVRSGRVTSLGGGAWDALVLTIDLDPDADTGLRSLVVDDGVERTVAVGHLEILEAPSLLDTDGDSILDVDERDLDTDSDGDVDWLDLDSDQDGIPDAVEAGDADTATPPRDSDSDGDPDCVDLDSDDDGLPDASEGTSDGDSDGWGAWRDADRDDGGEPDGSEVTWGRDPDSPGDDVTELPGEVPDGSTGAPVLVRWTPGGAEVSGAPASGADWHSAYRGDIGDLGVLPPVPIGCDLPVPAITDVAAPTAAYYLLTGSNWVGEGPAGAGRVLGPRCP